MEYERPQSTTVPWQVPRGAHNLGSSFGSRFYRLPVSLVEPPPSTSLGWQRVCNNPRILRAVVLELKRVTK
ncbi:unnamed protein product [Citrullus colocynthis]|uniref:Uncharacterized protein n=1 Tax=Citrullus colocynthis TaxID=252529 RepID=A0ABP0YJD4_9ROSI